VDLFDKGGEGADTVPLAERVRPRTLEAFIGQEHLLGSGKPIRVLIESDRPVSMILWGPPGSGKTTLARLIAHHTRASFFQLNAVSSGVKDVREVLDRATALRRTGTRTILFIDEIHRFNKAQQDALLHSVEEGLVSLIGATTENPSFEVISPLLSRCRVYVLNPLSPEQLQRVLNEAIRSDTFLADRIGSVQDVDVLLVYAGGDARIMLNGLEAAVRIASASRPPPLVMTKNDFENVFQRKVVRYDSAGEEHYNTISAFIKSLRGSDPDAAVYWLARMLEAGEDALFIARRMIILASEDIGNADPSALPLASACFAAVNSIGMPEARIMLAQTSIYLACSPKSNASYVAIEEALDDVRNGPDAAVPLHLRNAPTGLMAHLGYGREYRYGHSHAGNFVEQQYLPDGLTDRRYYRPTDNGAERSIRERLNAWWKSRLR
jgi:putative ATPase